MLLGATVVVWLMCLKIKLARQNSVKDKLDYSNISRDRMG